LVEVARLLHPRIDAVAPPKSGLPPNLNVYKGRHAADNQVKRAKTALEIAEKRALSDSASSDSDTERPVNSAAVEANTLLLTANAVRLLCKCSQTMALRTVAYHMNYTNDVGEAMWAACKDIKPSVAKQRFEEHDTPVYQIPASGRHFISEQLGRGTRVMTLVEVAQFRDHLFLFLNNPLLDDFDYIPQHLIHFWRHYVQANKSVEQGQLGNGLLQRRIYEQACEDLHREACTSCETAKRAKEAVLQSQHQLPEQMQVPAKSAAAAASYTHHVGGEPCLPKRKPDQLRLGAHHCSSTGEPCPKEVDMAPERRTLRRVSPSDLVPEQHCTTPPYTGVSSPPQPRQPMQTYDIGKTEANMKADQD